MCRAVARDKWRALTVSKLPGRRLSLRARARGESDYFLCSGPGIQTSRRRRRPGEPHTAVSTRKYVIYYYYTQQRVCVRAAAVTTGARHIITVILFVRFISNSDTTRGRQDWPDDETAARIACRTVVAERPYVRRTPNAPRRRHYTRKLAQSTERYRRSPTDV